MMQPNPNTVIYSYILKPSQHLKLLRQVVYISEKSKRDNHNVATYAEESAAVGPMYTSSLVGGGSL